MHLTSLLIIVAVVLPSSVVSAALTVQVDLQRNAPGATANSVVVVNNAPEDTFVYLIATSSNGDTTDIIDSNLVLTKGDHIVTPTVYPVANGQALLVASFNGLIDYGMWNVVPGGGVDEMAQPLLTIDLQAQTEILLLSCLNSEVHIKVPTAYANHYMSLVGKEQNESCSYQLGDLAASNSVRLNMTVCGLVYNSPFQISFRAHQEYNVDEDVVILMQCQAIDTILKLKNLDVNSDLTSVAGSDYLSTVQAMMFLHEQGNVNNVISNTIEVKTPVSLQITMDPLYSQDFDVVPIECFVNGYRVVDQGCASYPMANFTKTAVGKYRSDFKMFRTVVNGLPEQDLSFSCSLYVCHFGACPAIPCINNQVLESKR